MIKNDDIVTISREEYDKLNSLKNDYTSLDKEVKWPKEQLLTMNRQEV